MKINWFTVINTDAKNLILFQMWMNVCEILAIMEDHVPTLLAHSTVFVKRAGLDLLVL